MADTIVIETPVATVLEVSGKQGPQGVPGAGLSTLTTKGDTLYRGDTTGERLPIGTTGQVLKVASTGLPAWENESGGVPTSRTISAGTGLTGGGDLSANRTLSVSFGSAAPSALGTASVGSSNNVARADHVHAMPTATDVGAAASSHAHIVMSEIVDALIDDPTTGRDALGLGANSSVVFQELTIGALGTVDFSSAQNMQLAPVATKLDIKDTASEFLGSLRAQNDSLTANRNYELPNASGMLALTSDITKTAVGLGNVSNAAQVTSVTGTAPIVSSGGTTPAISINAATTSAAGSMSAADKTKLDAISGTNTGDQTITLTGDVTGSGTGSFSATIANNAVTNAKLAQVATSTIKGRATAATGNVEDLTATQVRTILNVADGATANSSDATLLNRANHTGTQAAGTITGLAASATTDTTNAANISSGVLANARVNFAAPAAIGSTTPAAGSFTNLSASAELQLPTNAPASPSAGDLYRVSDTLRYRDSSNAERLLLNASDNLSNLSNTATARTNLGLGGAATLSVGTTTGTVAAGDDSRFHTRSHAITSTSDHTASNWSVFYSNGSGQVTELALGAANTVLTSNGASSAPSFAAASSFNPASPGAIGGTTPSTGAFTSLSTAPAANTSALTTTGYSLTGSNAQSLVDLAGTWNTTGTPSAIKLNVTDTASNANSLLMQLQTGGTNRFTVSKGGAVVCASVNVGGGTLSVQSGDFFSNGYPVIRNGGTEVIALTANSNVGVNIRGTLSLGFNANANPSGLDPDLRLWRDGADTLAQYRGTNAQEKRLYGTYTSSTNYQRMTIKSVRQTLSALSGASATTTGTFIPDGAVVVGVTTRVATTITGATGYQVGDGTTAARWGDITGTAIGTTSDNVDWTVGTIECFTSGREITLTAKGSNFTAGAVEICVFYLAGQAD